MNQLKTGAVLSYVLIFVTTTVGLVLTPFIVNSLGKSEYGLYTMIGALVGYMTVLDFGLTNTIVRFVAKYRANKDKQGEEDFLAHSFILYSLIGVIIVFGGLIVYFNLENLYGDTLTADQMSKARKMFLILIFNLAVSLPGGAFRGICSGYEEFVLPRVANIIRYIFRSLLVFVLLIYGGDALGIILVDTGMNIFYIWITAIIAFKKLKVRIYLHHFRFSLLKAILSFSIWIFVFSLVNQLRWQVGQLILGVSFSTSVVAIYAVAITLGGYYGAFSSAIASVFLPRATQMVTLNASSRELTDMFIRVSRVILFVILYVFGGFVLVGKSFVNLWVGNDFAEVYYYVVIMMFGLTFILSQGFASNILEAKNKLKFRGIIILIMTLAGVLVGALLANKYQGLGMIIGTVIFILLDRIVMTWYYQKKVQLQMFHYYKNVAPLFLGVSVIVFGIYWIFSFNDFFSDFSRLVVVSFIYTLVYMALFWRLSTEQEKQLITGFLKTIKVKLWSKKD